MDIKLIDRMKEYPNYISEIGVKAELKIVETSYTNQSRKNNVYGEK